MVCCRIPLFIVRTTKNWFSPKKKRIKSFFLRVSTCLSVGLVLILTVGRLVICSIGPQRGSPPPGTLPPRDQPYKVLDFAPTTTPPRLCFQPRPLIGSRIYSRRIPLGENIQMSSTCFQPSPVRPTRAPSARSSSDANSR